MSGPSPSPAAHTEREPLPDLAPLARSLRCRQTDAEARIWARLRNRQLDGLKFRRQVPRGRFIADFLCDEAILILEIDGPQHDENVEQDLRRTRYLEQLGYYVMRLRNFDVLKNTERVLDHVCAVARERAKAPSSGPSGHLLPKGRRAGGMRAAKGLK